MQVTLGSLTQKHSYLIFFSLALLISCTNKEAVQSRRYLISNAEKLGIVNANYSNTSEPEDQAVYHKIFKNYQGTSDYKVKKTPKNNPYKVKEHHKSIAVETIHTIKKEASAVMPKAILSTTTTEQDTLVNHASSDKSDKAITIPVILPAITAAPESQMPKASDADLSPKQPVAMPEAQVAPPQMPKAEEPPANLAPAQGGSSSITPPPPMSLPEIKPAAYIESNNEGSAVTILPPLSSLFENEVAATTEDIYADKPLEDLVAQTIQENDVINNEIVDNSISNSPEQDSLDNFNSNDEVLTNEQVDNPNQDDGIISDKQTAENIPQNKKQTPIAPVGGFNKEANILKENQLLKREALEHKESTPFIKKYFAVDGKLLINNFAQLNIYSNLY